MIFCCSLQITHYNPQTNPQSPPLNVKDLNKKQQAHAECDSHVAHRSPVESFFFMFRPAREDSCIKNRNCRDGERHKKIKQANQVERTHLTLALRQAFKTY